MTSTSLRDETSEPHPNSNVASVILCDPEPARSRRMLGFEAHGFRVVHETTLDSLRPRCRDQRPVAVALPLNWPVESDARNTDTDTPALTFIRAHRHQFPIVVYADTTNMPVGVYCRALCAGAQQVFNESVASFPEDLMRYLRRLVHDSRDRAENEKELTELFAECGLIGQSPALHEVFRRAVKASQFHDLPVLIGGETGTGKQRLAEAIHRLDSKRNQKPFLTVNCSAIAKNLAESELFGHVKGAFSGAGTERPGLFRAANGGTLFLDEVGELDLDLQPKLLRLLQEQRLLPVGADQEHAVDLRVIAATNRSLEKMVQSGAFREDLYHRLRVFQIHIPPLRERPGDIGAQARHFLRMHQPHRQQPISDLAPLVLEALRSLPWDGNTRQLENLIREAVTWKDHGTLLQVEDLPTWALEALAGAVLSESLPGPAPGATLLEHLSLSNAMSAYERDLLKALLEKHGGNRTRAAVELGLTPRTLYNKLKKHRLFPE